MQSAVEGAQWSAGVGISFDGASVTLTSNGIPNHARQDQYLVPIAGVRVPTDASEAEIADDPTTAQDYSFEITTAPAYAEQTTATQLGPIGLMISGAALFNPYEADDSTTALDGNFDVNGVLFVDSCSGHPTPMGEYHYHGVPYCITDVLDEAGRHSFIIGLLFDGFGVYGPNGEDGEPPTDLDECNGHVGLTPDSSAPVYHYHLTEVAPYSIRCYHGEVDASKYAPPGPPQGG
jgi:YHYH protein